MERALWYSSCSRVAVQFHENNLRVLRLDRSTKYYKI
jgi:hypothetical protein